MPWPRSRNTRPLGVSSGHFQPERRSGQRRHAISPPSTAVVTGTGTRDVEILPRRSNTRVRQEVHASDRDRRRPAAGARFALAGGADPRAVLDAGGDPDVDRARLSVAAGSTSRRVVPLNASSSVRSTGCSNRGPRRGRGARPARRGRSARRRPATAEERAGRSPRTDRRVAEHLLHLFGRHRAVAAAAGPRQAALDGRRRRPPGACCACSYMRQFAPSSSVLPPLLRVPEHLVGLVDLLELRLGGLVARVQVRMVLARQLAVGLLDVASVAVFETPSVA